MQLEYLKLSLYSEYSAFYSSNIETHQCGLRTLRTFRHKAEGHFNKVRSDIFETKRYEVRGKSKAKFTNWSSVTFSVINTEIFVLTDSDDMTRD